MGGDRIDTAKGAGGGRAPVMLAPDDAAFIQSGVSILVAACGPDGAPLPGFGRGCVVDPARAGEVRVLVDRSRNEGLIAACAGGSPVAATFANLAHRSLQLKATRCELRPPEPGDLSALSVQAARYRDWLALLGYGDEYCAMFASYQPENVVAVAFRPEQAFIQTPGPAAGEPVRP